MGIFSKIREGLKKTKDSFIGKVQRVANSFTKIDEDLFDQLEETMIMSDIGVETSTEICERLRKKIKERGITDPSMIMDLLQEIISEMMGDDTGLDLTKSPAVIMVIGVNGAGKTTTIGKLCHQFKNEGKKVLVAAADTFRAAAIDQLQVWTERAGVDIVKHAEGSDPGAVVFDALTAAKARDCDVVIIDTAGRLHNKKNLMEELAKINRIIDQKSEECSREILLVLDATTGQNAVNQAKLFSEVAPITGIVLTKLDGTAKGGIVISIKNELGIPVKLVGVGEKIDDLQTFDSKSFVSALFDSDEEEADEEAEDAADEVTEESEDPYEAEDADEPAEAEEADDESEAYKPDESKTELRTDDDEMPFAAILTAEKAESAVKTEEAQETIVSEETADEAENDEYADDAEAAQDNEADEYDEAEEAEESEEAEEAPAEEEKPKKKGFFKRLFGGDR